MNDTQIEQYIQDKGLTAPRITPADIEANIVSEHYFTARDGRRGAIADGTYVGRERPRPAEEDLAALDLLTFCVIVLKNGFTVTGESACANPENFDAELGRKIARQNAVQKIWPLMGYLLKEQLYQNKITLKRKELAPNSFEFALVAIKEGKRVVRAGWNGKDQWVALSGPCEPREVLEVSFWSEHSRAFAISQGGTAKVAPGLLLKNAQDQIVMGWVPSTGDLLATDWYILPPMAK